MKWIKRRMDGGIVHGKKKSVKSGDVLKGDFCTVPSSKRAVLVVN